MTTMPSAKEIIRRILLSIVAFVMGTIALSITYFVIGIALVAILAYCCYYSLFGEY